MSVDRDEAIKEIESLIAVLSREPLSDRRRRFQAFEGDFDQISRHAQDMGFDEIVEALPWLLHALLLNLDSPYFDGTVFANAVAIEAAYRRGDDGLWIVAFGDYEHWRLPEAQPALYKALNVVITHELPRDVHCEKVLGLVALKRYVSEVPAELYELRNP